MFSKDIDTLLHKSIHALPRMLCSRSLKFDIDDLVNEVFAGMKLAVIDDGRTAEALGNEVFRALKERFRAIHITLDGIPYADQATVDHVRLLSKSCDALVAVGSGTISDICKFASFTDGKPYMVFPTAASMNGYVSVNASITSGGYKSTVAAQMPVAVFCDLGVIASAPARFNKSGLGDCLARPTAQADWLLSHYLLGTEYSEEPFALLKDEEPHLFEQARGIARGDEEAVKLLLTVLLLSGFGMTMAGGSYPASQGEHMIAHSYEMLTGAQKVKDEDAVITLHGEEIGVTSLYMAQLQQRLLHRLPSFAFPDFPRDMAELFGAKVAAEAKKAYVKKRELMEAAGLQEIGKGRWEEIATLMEKISLPPAQIQKILNDAQAPDRVEMLGWEESRYREAQRLARFTRDRFTFLDLAYSL